MSMVHHTLVLPWCEKMRISERLISDVFIKNIWMVLKKCVFLWTIYINNDHAGIKQKNQNDEAK